MRDLGSDTLSGVLEHTFLSSFIHAALPRLSLLLGCPLVFGELAVLLQKFVH